MNILFFLLPKNKVEYLFSDFTLRQTIEKISEHRYSMIPVLDRVSGKYLYSLSDGDILYYLRDNKLNFEDLENKKLSEIKLSRSINPVKINCKISDLYNSIINQNYVPVVDDNNIFIGIITRKSVINYLINNASQ